MLILGTKSSAPEPGAVAEALTIQVNPTTGSDVWVQRITTQALATAHGPFASIAGAVDALPRDVPDQRPVTIEHADGTWSVARSYFNGLEKLQTQLYWSTSLLVPTGGVRLTSASTFRTVTGTVDMPVASVSTHTVTLDSDPGYSANAYRERLLQIVSGTGASNQDGNPKPIRSHNGVDFVIVGQWDTPPDATSVVRIVEPACKIVVDDWYIPIAASGQNFEDVYSPALQIDGIEFAAATGQITLLATGGLIVLKNAIVNGGVLSESGNLGLRGAVVFSGGGGWTPGIWTIGGTIIDGGSVDAVLIRNNLYGGVIASAAKGATRIHLSNCAIDDVPDCISSDAHDILISLHARLQSSGCSGYGVKMLNNKATNVRLHTSWLASPYGLRGTLGELNLNGAVATYAELAAASEATLINGQCVVQGVTV